MRLSAGLKVEQGGDIREAFANDGVEGFDNDHVRRKAKA